MRPRDREALGQAWLDELRAAGRAAEAERSDRAERIASALLRERAAGRRQRLRIRWGLGFAIPALAATAWLLVTEGTADRRGGATAGSSVAREQRALCLGPGSIFAEGAGPVRAFAPGESLPFHVPLATRAERSSVRLEEDATVAIDPDSRIRLAHAEPRIVLLSGRIDVDVGPGAALEAQIAPAAATVRARDARFGLLAAEGRRWSVAVSRSEVQVLGAHSAMVRSGERHGVGPGGSIVAGRIPERFEISAEVSERDARPIVRGLVDLLAEVRVDGHGVDLAADGRFERSLLGDAVETKLIALDAAGRRVERRLSFPAQDRRGEVGRGPPRAANGELERAPPPARTQQRPEPEDAGRAATSPSPEEEKGWIRIGPMKW